MYQVSHHALQRENIQTPLPGALSSQDEPTDWGAPDPGTSECADGDSAQGCAYPLIAIVEDDGATVEMLGDLLAMSGYRTLHISRGECAYPAIRAAQPQLVLLDLWLEHHDAGSMAVGLLSIDPITAHIPIVLCSAQVGDYRVRNDQVLQKAAAVVEKPFAIDELLTTIQATLASARPPAGETKTAS